MPEWAPLAKVTAARRHGAEVILHGENFDEAHARAREIEAERGLVFVHPFDDARVIAGQGTIGLELLEQVPDLDAVLVPVGGGGLIGGIATAIKAEQPARQGDRRAGAGVAAVQAALAPATPRSACRPPPPSPTASRYAAWASTRWPSPGATSTTS